MQEKLLKKVASLKIDEDADLRRTEWMDSMLEKWMENSSKKTAQLFRLEIGSLKDKPKAI
jgi:hypothetical protein